MNSNASGGTALPVLGILGGMGPLATVDFFGKIVAHTPARTDQEHMPILIFNLPQVPDRSAAFLAGSDAPWEPLRDGVLMLAAAGVQAIAIPCNTAHLWHARLAATTGVPILHIGTAAADQLVATRPGVSRVGILATTATVQAGIYARELARHDIAVVAPDEATQESRVMAGIRAVKAGDVAAARELLLAAARTLLAGSAAPQALLLACTEVPIALANADLPVPSIDTSDALARACVRWWLDARRRTGS